MLITGAVYDIREKYDDVFYVVGALYMVDAIIFAAIPGLEWWRRYTGQSTYDDIAGMGAGAGQTHTVKVPQRSISKNSLANETEGVIEYGATADTKLNNMSTGGYGGGGGQNGFAPSYNSNISNNWGPGGGGGSQNPHNPFKSQQQQQQGGMGDGGGWKPNNLNTEQSNLAHAGGGGGQAYGSRGQSIPLQHRGGGGGGGGGAYD